jgi:hypothetical protein
MAAASDHRSFIDSILARLIALAIAVLIGVIFFVYWADDIRTLMAGDEPQIPVFAEQGPVVGVNPALQDCLDQRVGDVDKMKAEGIVNDAQYASFRQRAEELCRAQHAE